MTYQHPSSSLSTSAQLALDEVLARDDPGIVGLVLSGSAARGMATSRSDVDVYVIWRDGANPAAGVLRSPAIDEFPMTFRQLEATPPFGTEGWWFRWSFAWAEVLVDKTEGRVSSAVRRQATLTEVEEDSVLSSRLDGYINFAYGALKADRDGRPLERRLDAAESVPWLLDVVFALCGRVRPYNKYLAWELREHPLPVVEWQADRFLLRIEAMLDGDPQAVRSAFAPVDAECRRHDAKRGNQRLGDTIDDWGQELQLFTE